MSPSFSYKTLEKRLDFVNNYSEHLFKLFDKEQEHVDMYKYLAPYMFDVICNSFMGVDYNLLHNLENPYLEASKKVVSMITQTFFSYWSYLPGIYNLTPFYRSILEVTKTLSSSSTEMIQERRRKINERLEKIKLGQIKANTDDECEYLLDTFLQGKLHNGDPIPDEMINEEITLLCWTGHYTTSKTMSHTLYLLAKHPEIQKKIYEEQVAVLKNNMSRKVTNHDLNEMKYLEAAIKETLRVLPTVSTIGRQLKNDLKLKGDQIVPAQASILMFFEAMYQNPKLFPEPEKYKPERFFDSMHSYAFIPFSAGPRNCLGFRFAWVAMKATISNIIRRYELTLAAPGTEPQFVYRIVTESTNGLNLKLKRRSN
ncbi:probable cytochrome P450 4d20 isoform X2 [Leptidea sinapis]|nr:probable cytochrome P450 4d20 isoform X2 [Leptidea sinapis]